MGCCVRLPPVELVCKLLASYSIRKMSRLNNQNGGQRSTVSLLSSTGLSAFLLATCIAFNDDSVEGYGRESLRQLVVRRVGLETFAAKLGEVSRHELYSKAAKHPQLRAKAPHDLLIDYEFCRLFKVLEGCRLASPLFITSHRTGPLVLG